MRGPARVPALLLVAALSLESGLVAAAGETPAARAGASAGEGATDDPWTAWDLLDPDAGVGTGIHWEAGVRSREAVAGELEGTFLGSVEPGRGLGGTVRWRHWASPEGLSADDLLGGVIGRAPRLRIFLGAGRLASGRDAVIRGAADLRARVLGPVLVGGRASLHPGEPAWAPEVRAEIDAALRPWWGGLTLGPGAGEARLALGLRLRPGMVWTVAYDGGAADLGIAWSLGAVGLRADEVAHPLLGSVRRVRVVGGRRP